jgi:hypothetical protein
MEKNWSINSDSELWENFEIKKRKRRDVSKKQKFKQFFEKIK